MTHTYVSSGDVHNHSYDGSASLKLNIRRASRRQDFNLVFKVYHHQSCHLTRRMTDQLSVYELRRSFPTTIRFMKNDCHVSSTIPLPSFIQRWTRRTSSHIKYVSGLTPNCCFVQQYVGSSNYSSPRSCPSPVSYEPSSCASLSPPSSQNEYFPKLPTLPRPRPKIQVASLLVGPQTRCVLYGVECAKAEWQDIV